MATIEQFQKLTKHEKQHRYFSEDFKRRKVSELDRNLVGVAEVAREYQVSRSSIYKWIYKYSIMRKRQERFVLESESDSRKIEELKQKIKELERIVGQKQVEVEFLHKMIEITEEDLNIDIKKKAASKLSSGSGQGEKNKKLK